MSHFRENGDDLDLVDQVCDVANSSVVCLGRAGVFWFVCLFLINYYNYYFARAHLSLHRSSRFRMR